jgi:choline dehydrogenase-like flavoprotein
VILPALLNRSNFELRTNCEVLQINLDSTRKKATGVTYVDGTGTEYEQPAELVLITAFPLNNVRTLLLSRIGEPPGLERALSVATTLTRPPAGPLCLWTRVSTSTRSCRRAPPGP